MDRQALLLRQSKYDVPPGIMYKENVDLADVLTALRRIPDRHWRCRSRENVRPLSASTIDAMTLGLIVSKSSKGIPVPSKPTWLYPNLCELLLRFLRRHLSGAGALGLEFDASSPLSEDMMCTSIQLNKNYCAREHVDINNLGPSWLIALGDWTSGGELWVEDPTGDEQHVVGSDVHGRGNRMVYRAGECCRGRTVDVRDKWFSFDGRRLHFVRDFGGGERFSIVFFVTRRCSAAPDIARSFLTRLGFQFPKSLSGPSVTKIRLSSLALSTRRERPPDDDIVMATDGYRNASIDGLVVLPRRHALKYRKIS